MSETTDLREDYLQQIADTHEAFISVMNERIVEVSDRELELYLGLLGTLVSKVDDRDKDLRMAAQEVFGEISAVVMRELGMG